MSGRTSFASPSFAAAKRIKNDSPVSVIPIAILVGVEGSLPLLSSHFQNHTSGKVSVTIQNGLIALEIVPVTFQSVLSSAQYVSVEPFWWKTIQKTMTIRKITIKAPMRFRSETFSISPPRPTVGSDLPLFLASMTDLSSTMFLNIQRIDTEMTIPNAAIANAGWKPQRAFTTSITTGARNAPMFMPI